MRKYFTAVLILTAAVIFFPALPMAAPHKHTSHTSQKSEIPEKKENLSEQPYKVLDVSTGEIIEVPVRDYVIGAVCAEMPAEFHSEALKAQAVAAHTYAERQRLHEREFPAPELNGADFSTDVSQYQGYYTAEQAELFFGTDFEKNYKRISEAADEVMDYVITYDDEPIISAFHSMSSGVTESAENAWGAPVSYLVPVDSSSDIDAPKYTDEVRYDREVLRNKLETAFSEIVLDDDCPAWILVRETSESGTVLKADVGNMTATGAEIRNALALRSPCFEVRYEGSETIITTKGYGHCVGMSQYGANAMAASGKTWKQILNHYYTGCKIEKYSQ